MSFLQDKRKRKRFIVIVSITLVIAILFTACAIYLCDHYEADEDAIAAFAPNNTVKTQNLENGNTVFRTDEIRAGFIFYPGGKVESEAYKPLMISLASYGFLCVLVDMPFNLAVLDINAADGIQQQFPEVKDWYIGGHSLGGAMAASYLGDNSESFKGLALLGAYSTEDLSGTDLSVISIYGSEDKVMDRQEYESNKQNLPKNFKEIVIEGGCHSYFGMYGAQDGDGIPSWSNQDQIVYTAQQITRYFIHGE
ncbi:MAG: alpha/beta hydrolase [Clostridia bacterium]|nr:alpha/beta hydrolase [Clostridia bacterium]